jgi:hypothetical protein
MAMRIEWAVVLCAALGGCASYDGRGLVPGKSTAAEVEAAMGRPAEKAEGTGESIWWYPRGPSGWHSYAVRVGADGVMRGIEQRLTSENVRRIAAGASNRKDVRELLGPPFVVSRLSLKEREVWEYQILDVDFKWKLWVQFSGDGVVREVLQMRHPDMDPGSDSGKS